VGYLLRTAFVGASIAMGAAQASELVRSRAQIRGFRAEYPCPSTGRIRGACPGWQVDHIRPLCAGGEDKRSNMHWLATEDHRFKTSVDVRECRKLRQMAATPAR
jgi:hypothetical protein